MVLLEGEPTNTGDEKSRNLAIDYQIPRLPDSQISRLLPSRDLVPERRAAATDERANARALLAADRRADTGADARGRSDDHCALLHRALRLDDALRSALVADPLRCGFRYDLARVPGAPHLRVVT